MMKCQIEKVLKQWYGKIIALSIIIILPLLFWISIEYHLLGLGLLVIAVVIAMMLFGL